MRHFGFGFAVGFVDRVEHLHEPPRVPQFEILGDHSDEMDVRASVKMVASGELQVSGAEDRGIDGGRSP